MEERTVNNRIQKMVEEMCPDGVEYRRLGEVTAIKRGERIVKKRLQEDGQYAVISGGVNPMGRTDKHNRNANTITISSYGTAGYVNFITEDFWANDVCLCVYPCSDDIDNKFLYYALKSKQDYFYRNTTKAIPDHIPTNVIKDTEIPVPPLQVQEEIVRMLDAFTKLTAELTTELAAELAMRTKQYAYYRDKLLKLEGVKGVEYKRLGDIGKFYGGLTGKNKYDFDNGNALYATYKNVYANPALDIGLAETVSISTGEKQNALAYGDIIFTGSSETPDECGLSSVVTEQPEDSLYLNSFCFFLRPNDTNILLPDFAKHLFRSSAIRRQIVRTANGVTRFNVSKEKMKNILIPIPPMEAQKDIASKLDAFSSYCTDLTSGLPAEIEARNKQYAYYRDAILQFDGK